MSVLCKGPHFPLAGTLAPGEDPEAVCGEGPACLFVSLRNTRAPPLITQVCGTRVGGLPGLAGFGAPFTGTQRASGLWRGEGEGRGGQSVAGESLAGAQSRGFLPPAMGGGVGGQASDRDRGQAVGHTGGEHGRG